MRVFLTGGTGTIGRRLAHRLRDRGDVPVILTRDAEKVRRDPIYAGLEVVQGDPSQQGSWQNAVDGCDAVVNLSGENLFAHRWNVEVKRRIRDSRVYGAEHVVEAIRRAGKPPRVLVQGSAVGYYGSRKDDVLTESSTAGSDFLAVVCRELEEAAHQVESPETRLAIIRTGVVLVAGEGALGVMTPIFKSGAATPIGNGGHRFLPARGPQWISWIHLEDILGLFLFALDRPDARGPINGTAPNPSRNIDFSRALARQLHRPFIPLGPPDLAVELMLGEVASAVTNGQRVVPNRARELGYRFAYDDLTRALEAAFADSGHQPVAAGSA